MSRVKHSPDTKKSAVEPSQSIDAVIWAISSPNTKEANEYIQQLPKEDFLKTSEHGKTAIHEAIDKGLINIIALLIRKNKKVLYCKNAKGMSESLSFCDAEVSINAL